MHAADHDDIRARARRFARKAERIANIVGNILDFGTLVVVGEDYGVAFFGKRANLVVQGVIRRGERCNHG